MKRLWAPWRIEFIKRAHLKPKGCIFCELPKKGLNKDNLVLFKGEHSFVIMNRYPYVSGHLMVIPHRHTCDFSSLSAAEHTEMGQLLSWCSTILKKEMHAHGFNIGMNLGEAAGAGIKDHLHYHIMPRWNGDTNFMSAVGDLRVIPESLQKNYSRLKKHFK